MTSALIFGFGLLLSADSHYHDLVRSHRIFELRDAIQIDNTGPEADYFQGVVDSYFNQPNKAAQELSAFLGRNVGPNDAILKAKQLLAGDYVSLGRYAQAAEVYRTTGGSPEERKDQENVARLWGALAGVPVQTAEFTADTRVKLKDKAQIRLPIEISGQSFDVLLDTGANVSVIMRSLAESLRLDVHKADVEVGNVAGQMMKADVGVARTVKAGNVLFHNVVFLVMDDKDLRPAPDFQIKMILGFPVLRALRELRISEDGYLTIPASKGTYTERNLGLDDLTPTVEGQVAGKRVFLTLDSGADKSVLYRPFIDAFPEILATGKESKSTSTGLGGSRVLSAVKLNLVRLQIGTVAGDLRNVSVLKEKTTSESDHYYGNLGQDFLGQFRSWTLSFDSMALVLQR